MHTPLTETAMADNTNDGRKMFMHILGLRINPRLIAEYGEGRDPDSGEVGKTFVRYSGMETDDAVALLDCTVEEFDQAIDDWEEA